MFSISRCSGIDGLYSTAIEVHVLDGKRSLRKWLTAMHVSFRSFQNAKTPTIEAESAVLFIS